MQNDELLPMTKALRLEGFNGAISQAVRALRYLADHDRPSNGEQFPNSASCHMVANELELTMQLFEPAISAWNTRLTAPSDEDRTAGEERLREAAQELLDGLTSTYRARNGREVGIEADDGEKCYIVHSELVAGLRAALAQPKGGDHE